MRPPWDVDLERIEWDFSEFHPIDHSVRQCRGYPGGRRAHLRFKWDFFWRPAIGEALLCRFGRHDPVRWYAHTGGDRRNPRNYKTGYCCARCGRATD